MFDELRCHSKFGGFGGFLPGIMQIANVAALPGIVHVIYNFVFYMLKMFSEINWIA